MMAASTIGYGSIFVVYPLISPFEMVAIKHRYPIQSLCTIFHAISGISLWFLGEKAGMKEKWEGNNAYYYLLYLLFIPYLGIGIMFIVIMHYPLSPIARLVHMKPMIVGFLTVFFYFSGRVVINSSTAAIDGNAKSSNGASEGKECKCPHGSTLSSVNLGINLLVLNITKYISEAYIQRFITTRDAYKPGEPWPTEGMSVTDGFLYWLFVGIEEGFVSFKESFDQNVKGKLEHTLMVVNSELKEYDYAWSTAFVLMCHSSISVGNTCNFSGVIHNKRH
uniref:Integral membrane protein n=1 Tax=Babesia bovis TaxID=5865 RepID=S6AZ02_BABBO|nr:integral membrane protein [Babesia bovis]